jgi:hypothetical protein
LEFQIVTVAWFTGFKAVTVALFTGFELVTVVDLLAVARFLYINQAFVVLLFDSFILVNSSSCLGSFKSMVRALQWCRLILLVMLRRLRHNS